jgi:hypothetical protein
MQFGPPHAPDLLGILGPGAPVRVGAAQATQVWAVGSISKVISVSLHIYFLGQKFGQSRYYPNL